MQAGIIVRGVSQTVRLAVVVFKNPVTSLHQRPCLDKADGGSCVLIGSRINNSRRKRCRNPSIFCHNRGCLFLWLGFVCKACNLGDDESNCKKPFHEKHPWFRVVHNFLLLHIVYIITYAIRCRSKKTFLLKPHFQEIQEGICNMDRCIVFSWAQRDN